MISIGGKVIADNEAFPALRADVGLLPWVIPLVPIEAALTTVAPSAVHALEGLLPRVGSLVRGQDRFQAEIFPALQALVGLLSRVGSLVPLEAPAAIEAYPALGTSVGLLPRVGSLMRGQGPAVAEALSAFRTTVRLLPCVGHTVPVEVRFIFAYLPTDGTLDPPLPLATLLRDQEIVDVGILKSRRVLLALGWFGRLFLIWEGLFSCFRAGCF